MSGGRSQRQIRLVDPGALAVETHPAPAVAVLLRLDHLDDARIDLIIERLFGRARKQRGRAHGSALQPCAIARRICTASRGMMLVSVCAIARTCRPTSLPAISGCFSIT